MEKMSDVGLVAQAVVEGDTHPRCGLSYRLLMFQSLYFIITEEQNVISHIWCAHSASALRAPNTWTWKIALGNIYLPSLHPNNY